MKYRWILFDADGTLFDYDAAERKALTRTLMQFSIPVDERALAFYREINVSLWQKFESGEMTQGYIKIERFRVLFERLALSATPDPAQFSAQYLENLGACADLVDGAEDILRNLHGHVNLALITNGISAVQRARLARSSIEEYLQATIISEEVGAAKPDARIFDAAFVAMGMPPREAVLMVGDSLSSDIKGGNDYAIDTCWFNPAGAPPTSVRSVYEIRRLADLSEIVFAVEP